VKPDIDVVANNPSRTAGEKAVNRGESRRAKNEMGMIEDASVEAAGGSVLVSPAGDGAGRLRVRTVLADFSTDRNLWGGVALAGLFVAFVRTFS